MRRLLLLWQLALVYCLLGISDTKAQDSSIKKPVIVWLDPASGFPSAQLQWSIEHQNEIPDSLAFIIERSADGKIFNTIASPQFAILNGKAFTYTDIYNDTDSVYYRITLQARNFGSIVSELKKVQMQAKPKIEINVMPNPVFNNASLILNWEETGDLNCTLFDMTGKAMRTYQLKKLTAYSQHILEMYNIPKGEYILNIRGGSINESRRVLKQ